MAKLKYQLPSSTTEHLHRSLRVTIDALSAYLSRGDPGAKAETQLRTEAIAGITPSSRCLHRDRQSADPFPPPGPE